MRTFISSFEKDYIKAPCYLLLLIFITLLVYYNSLGGEFIIDDYAGLLQNSRIHDIKDYFTKYIKPDISTFAEVTTVLSWHFFKSKTFGYHLVSVVAHILCVISLFWLCRVLFKNKNLAFLSSLIFAVHPIHTEAVSWISGRFYVFSSIFYILSFIFYVKSDKSLLHLLVSIFFLGVCFLTGNQVASLPLLFLFFDIFFREKGIEVEKTLQLRRLKVLILAILFLLSFLFILLKYFEEKGSSLTIYKYEGLPYLTVAIKAVAYYLKVIFYPLRRGLFHSFGYSNVNFGKLSPLFFASVFVIVILIAIFFKLRKGRLFGVSLGIMWFFITYLPYSNLFPICNIVAERYMYLPSVGFSIAIATLLINIWENIGTSSKIKTKRILRMIFIICLTIFLTTYSILTISNNIDFSNPITYWVTNVYNFPDGIVAYNNLAGNFYRAKDYKNAVGYTRVNLALEPNQPHVWCNLALLYKELGYYPDAIKCYKEALKLKESYPLAVKGLSEVEKIFEGKGINED